jgi:hypothetical protein
VRARSARAALRRSVSRDRSRAEHEERGLMLREGSMSVSAVSRATGSAAASHWVQPSARQSALASCRITLSVPRKLTPAHVAARA